MNDLTVATGRPWHQVMCEHCSHPPHPWGLCLEFQTLRLSPTREIITGTCQCTGKAPKGA